MRDIGLQIKRGLKSKGCLFAVLLMLYSLLFVHTDTPVFFRQPFTYFHEGSTFYYHFIISFWMGLSRYIVPIAAILPLAFFHCDDTQSGFKTLSEYRLPRAKYMVHRIIAAVVTAMTVVLIACAVFTMFLLIMCTMKGGEQEAWLLYRKGTAFEKLATVKQFPLFILSEFLRLMLSAATWALVAATFSLMWSNKAFVFVATFGTSILLDVVLEKCLGAEFTIAFLQTPDLDTQTPLTILLARQLLILCISAVLCGIAVCIHSSKHVIKLRQKFQLVLAKHIKEREQRTEWNLSQGSKGTFFGEVLTDIRSFITLQTILPSVAIPILVALCKPIFQTKRHSIGDLWLGVFGGFYWFEPQVDFTPIGLWIMLLLPPMMGVALSLEREFSTRRQMTIFRYSTKMRWWTCKCIAVVVYSFVSCAVMFLSVAVLGILTGSNGFGVLMEDAEGFMSANYMVLLQTFCLFAGQIIMLTQIQSLIHMATGRLQLGVIAYILPCIACLISCSVFDRMVNMYIPYNWGMMLRSSIFSPTYMYISETETCPLCATDIYVDMTAQAGAAALLIIISLVCAKAIRLTEREVKE